MVTVKTKSRLLEDQYSEPTYFDNIKWRSCLVAKSRIKEPQYKFEEYDYISNVTNCESGEFHKWIFKDNTLICKLCNIKISDVDTSAKMTEKILANYLKLKDYKLIKNYCDKLVSYIKKNKINCDSCLKCKNKDLDKLDDKDIIKIKENINLMIKQEAKEEKIIDKKSQKIERSNVKDIVNDVKSDYGQSKRHKEDYFYFVDNFIKTLESILGQEINIYNKNIYLRTDSYIIDHDHNGYLIEKPYYIKDEGNRIMYKKDHPFFKQDVIYYTNNRLQIDVFYNPLTKLLLGYKEKNKDFSYPKMKNVYLKSNPSLMTMIKTLGYPSKFIDISDKMKEYNELYKEEFSLIQTISDISRNRIKHLKKVITDIQRFINRTVYNYEGGLLDPEDNPDSFINKYKNKLNNLDLSNFFENWEDIKENIYFESLVGKQVNISPESKFLFYEEVSNYDYSGNVILFYIVSEVNNLINSNKDKFIKSNLSYLLIDIFIREYIEFNIEDEMTNSETKRFKYILTVKSDREVDILSQDADTEWLYEDYKDDDEEMSDEAKEKLYDAQQEEESLDVEDNELDYEVDYEPGVNIGG